MSSSLLHELTPTTDVSHAVAARARALTKTYGDGDGAVHALAGVDVTFNSGQFTAVMGPSGSGKSTLMQLMAALDTPTSGIVTIGSTDVTALSDKELTRLRRDRIGFVFQAFRTREQLAGGRRGRTPQHGNNLAVTRSGRVTSRSFGRADDTPGKSRRPVDAVERTRAIRSTHVKPRRPQQPCEGSGDGTTRRSGRP